MATHPYFLGIYEGHADPAVALVQNGKVIAYAEEERFIRFKHAFAIYPRHALKYCLDVAGITLSDVAAVAINWDIDAYSDGTMKKFYEDNENDYPIKKEVKERLLGHFQRPVTEERHHGHWRRMFGDIKFPPIVCAPHHYTHAFQATMMSPFSESVCLTLDGHGEQYTTTVWEHRGENLTPIHRITVPHSMGWFYAAVTEYLGFDAYDGEYKVMGLAAYGRPNKELVEKLGKLILPDPGKPYSYKIDHTYLHGKNTYSSRFTDKFVELLGRPPKIASEEFTRWHEDLAYAAQYHLEQTATNLVRWAVKTTGISNVTVGGGVGLNVKMNSAIFDMPEVADVWANPLCSDGGTPVGAALIADHNATGSKPRPLTRLDLGYEEGNDVIEKALKTAKLTYHKSDDIQKEVAKELSEGKIVAWFQGRMEGGPRALGQRSILADPRKVESRDQVNAIIKFREYWRPFCPSITKEAAKDYFESYTEAPFMVISFKANDKLRQDAPAVVHVDGTARVQLVDEREHPKYHGLIKEFEKLTGVPVLLNTSFNVKGEPVVCTAKDALRTFWSTGLDTLAIGDFIVRKER